MKEMNAQRVDNKKNIAEEFKQDTERVTSLPFYFSLELVRGCCSKCVMCEAHKQKIKYIDYAFAREVIKNISA